MANSLRKKVPPPPDPEKLTADKEAEVTVTEVVKDERTAKIRGSICLLLTVFLFVSLTSYLFTWQEDQDKVHQFGIRIFATLTMYMLPTCSVCWALTWLTCSYTKDLDWHLTCSVPVFLYSVPTCFSAKKYSAWAGT
jgi:hypothetical protein